MKIDVKNKPIMRFPDSHPAKRFLLAHRAFCNQWVGFEISFPNSPGRPDPIWNSQVAEREIRLSSVLYKYISFTPVLNEWLTAAPCMSEYELSELKTIETIESLVREMKSACPHEMIVIHKEMLLALRDLLTDWRRSIEQRLSYQKHRSPNS